MINYKIGDATNPISTGPKVIAHIVNDLGLWGAGFVMAISNKWPEVSKEYVKWAKGTNELFQLGQVQFVQVENDIWVANMVAQRGVRNENNPKPLNTYFLTYALSVVEDWSWHANASVHMPRIGCGLAGGTWDEIEPILKSVFPSQDSVNVTVYDLE